MSSPCLWPVFEGAGEPGIFSVPEPRGKLGIFSNPRACMKETVRRVTPQTSLCSVLRQQAVFEKGEETEIVRSPRAYKEGESSGFVHVSEPRGKLEILTCFMS